MIKTQKVNQRASWGGGGGYACDQRRRWEGLGVVQDLRAASPAQIALDGA